MATTSKGENIRGSIPWRKLLLEAFVVVGSVYMAIVLEGLSEARGRHADAVEALGNLRVELGQDRADLSDILDAQRDRDVRHRRIDEWLASPARVPGDSLAADLYTLFSVNRTMFPRNSSWTTMVAAGQLTDLDDPDLVSRLANLYENLNARLEYNGALYDDWVGSVAQTGLPRIWDGVENRLVTSDVSEVNRFRTELGVLHDLGVNFIGLLEAWGEELDEVTVEVDGYLSRQGGGA